MEDADGQSADWDGDVDWEEDSASEVPAADLEWQAYYDAVTSKPAWPTRVLGWVLGGVMTLALALAVIVQWGLWIALTMQLFDGWGGIAGGLIAAVQMWLMFGTAEKKQSCSL